MYVNVYTGCHILKDPAKELLEKGSNRKVAGNFGGHSVVTLNLGLFFEGTHYFRSWFREERKILPPLKKLYLESSAIFETKMKNSWFHFK